LAQIFLIQLAIKGSSNSHLTQRLLYTTWGKQNKIEICIEMNNKRQQTAGRLDRIKV